MDDLNDQRMAFVRAYLLDPNAKQAAIKAGYAPRSAEGTGSRLLRNAKVAAAIAEGLAKIRKKLETEFDLTLDDVLREYQRVAFTGMSRFLRIVDGTPHIDLSACTPADLDLLSEVTTETFKTGTGVLAKEVLRVKIKPLDRLNALDKLGRYLGMGDKAANDTMNALTEAVIAIGRKGSAAPLAAD